MCCDIGSRCESRGRCVVKTTAISTVTKTVNAGKSTDAASTDTASTDAASTESPIRTWGLVGTLLALGLL